MHILKHEAFITGTVEPGEVYNLKKGPYVDFWDKQKSYEGELFISQPCPFFPFSETVLISKGFYDYAHIPSTTNTIFVSKKTIEVFSILNMPKFQYWPIKYMVRKKLYDAYWLAFYHDYGLDTDFNSSIFKISYQDNKPDILVKLKDIDEYRSLVKYRYTHQNQKRDFDEIRPVQIKFKPQVYELDIITIFHYTTALLASDNCKNLFEKYKINRFRFLENTNYGGVDFI